MLPLSIPRGGHCVVLVYLPAAPVCDDSSESRSTRMPRSYTHVKNSRDLFCSSLCGRETAAVAVAAAAGLSLLLSVFRAKWDASGSLGQKRLSL